ncbi:MAG: ribonuclease H-like domain-containing protein [Candidatus Pacearchaeota archaeon]|jgi:hypothetical protein|nr:ribonuclease H-like domain-containing protein [Clostridia bacterium]
MINANKLFYWDIETAGKYSDFNSFSKNDERGAHLFEGKVKRKQKQNPNDLQWTGTVDECYQKNASLIAEYGRIVCISYAYYNTDGSLKLGSIKNEDESLLIKEAKKVFDQVHSVNLTLCGYNIKSFDIPWVFKKMCMNGIVPSGNISTYNKKPWDITCLDLMEFWKSSSYESVTFDEMAYSLGVPSPKSEMDGTMVHAYFYAGRINDIVKYCEADVMALVNAAHAIANLQS